MVECQLPPTLCWDHPGFCPGEARLTSPHSGITPSSRLHRPQERKSHPQNRTSMAGSEAQREAVTCPWRQSSSEAKLAAPLVTDTFLCSTCILLTARGHAPRGQSRIFGPPSNGLSLISVPAHWLGSGDSDFLKTQLSTSRQPDWGNPLQVACPPLCLSAQPRKTLPCRDRGLSKNLPGPWLPLWGRG